MKNLSQALLFVTLFAPQLVLSAEPPLAGHWKLDDKGSDSVLDSSPAKNHAKAVGQPTPATGKIGGALSFNGKTNYIEIPNSKELEKIQDGSFTISAWFKPEIAPPGTEDTANDSEFGIVLKTGWHEGLSYNRNKAFIMTHWLHGDAEPVWNGIGTWEEQNEPGQWYHLVGVVDQKERVVKIFVNGELKRTSDPWSAGAKTRNYEQLTWKIGVANPGAEQYAWYAKGAIDDVRIYKDSLTDDQVKALYDAGSAGKEK